MPKKNKKSLDLSFKVERSNELNQLNPRGLSLTEVRFLAIYQAKINARNPDTRTVIFPLAEFCKIMDISQLTVTHIKRVADNLICKPVHLPCEDGSNGFTVVPLFNECEVKQDKETGEWFVKIECHQKVMPYMFEMKRNYFTYELWNALKLKSVNQVRMYEILKQYEKIGERVESVENLKLMLGISNKNYSLFSDFRRDVLEVCQKALEQYTDIKYTFEPMRKGRKIHALKFTITKNKNFKDDLKLKEFIKPEDLEDIQIDAIIHSLYYRCKEEYTIKQLEQLYDYVSNCGINISSGADNYIYSIYANIKISGNMVNNLFKYTFSIIKEDINKHMFEDSRDNSNSHTSRSDEMYISSYDINEVVRNHKIEWYTQEDLENQGIKIPDKVDKTVEDEPIKEEPQKIEEPVVVQEAYERKKSQELPVIEFRFAFDKDLTDYVNYDSCKRLQALLELKYHKEDTFWLFEDIFTQKDIIKLVLERHQVVVVPKPVGDFSDFEKYDTL